MHFLNQPFDNEGVARYREKKTKQTNKPYKHLVVKHVNHGE